MGKIVITFGTFDLFHVGHLNILERAKSYGDKLVVGISSDEMNLKEKNKVALIDQEDRAKIVRAIRYVDYVFFEESLSLKEKYIEEFNADILVMGDDWKGKFDNMPCDVIYLPRTKHVSSTKIRRVIVGDGMAEAEIRSV